MTDNDVIQLEDLPEEFVGPIHGEIDESLTDLNFRDAKGKHLEQFTKQYLGKLLDKYDGNIAKISRKAGMSRKTIYRMMKNYGIKH